MKHFLAFAALALLFSAPAAAFDSEPLLGSTHSYMTEYGIDNAGSTELDKYREQIVAGSNTELHELDIDPNLKPYGVPLDKKRREHKGTNAGTDDIGGWWKDAMAAYELGNKEQAYFYIGIMLHMIEDMGSPAHALEQEHQKFPNFDNLEFMGLFNWRPDYADPINKTDPGYTDPSEYYAFSQKWTKSDASNYKSSKFSKFWFLARPDQRKLLANRQARTREIVLWTLKSVAKAFKAP